jgi:hypothetical protein
MGIRYLWIDSLCIVQDDEKEWEVEAARMASIFENSYLTVAVHQMRPNASSVYNSDGITGSVSVIAPLRYSLQGEMAGKVLQPSGSRTIFKERKIQYRLRSMPLEGPHDIERDHLSKRGWCFQVYHVEICVSENKLMKILGTAIAQQNTAPHDE